MNLETNSRKTSFFDGFEKKKEWNMKRQLTYQDHSENLNRAKNMFQILFDLTLYMHAGVNSFK